MRLTARGHRRRCRRRPSRDPRRGRCPIRRFVPAKMACDVWSTAAGHRIEPWLRAGRGPARDRSAPHRAAEHRRCRRRRQAAATARGSASDAGVGACPVPEPTRARGAALGSAAARAPGGPTGTCGVAGGAREAEPGANRRAASNARQRAAAIPGVTGADAIPRTRGRPPSIRGDYRVAAAALGREGDRRRRPAGLATYAWWATPYYRLERFPDALREVTRRRSRSVPAAPSIKRRRDPAPKRRRRPGQPGMRHDCLRALLVALTIRAGAGCTCHSPVAGRWRRHRRGPAGRSRRRRWDPDARGADLHLALRQPSIHGYCADRNRRATTRA
jgi:hypothetical protein